MSYTALARKWRPRRFDELVGQEHVLRALVNALDTQRVHHAFLFTGTRGVGKTTIARILAKCLNCERGVSANPCGVCSACREVDEGRFIDLIEVDAASRTKIDDTRELLDNVQYAPSRGRYKVYLIDEVHMLSTHSFNALLKTLEEPPPHVKFLLATTDPQKLPITVLSRCLQFNLKRLPVALIGERLRHVLTEEKIEFDGAGVRLVAEAADGSLRDALSLLDQLIAFGGGRATEPEARSMLGTIDRAHVVELVRRLASGDAPGLLAFARSLEEWAPDYAQMLDALAALLARIALFQVVPDAAGDEVHPSELLAGFAAQMAPEDTQLFYQTAILGRRDLPHAPDPVTGFEMTLLRMLAFRPAGGGTALGAGNDSAPRARSAAGASAAASASASASASAVSLSRAGSVAADSAGASSAATAATGPSSTGLSSTGESSNHAVDWAGTLARLELGGAARQLASHCVWLGREGAVVRLALDGRNRHLRTAAIEDRLATALSRHFGETVKLEIEVASSQIDTPATLDERSAALELEQARESLTADSTVRALQDRFGAVLQQDSVRPHRGGRPN